LNTSLSKINYKIEQEKRNQQKLEENSASLQQKFRNFREEKNQLRDHIKQLQITRYVSPAFSLPLLPHILLGRGAREREKTKYTRKCQ
jgi:hypothetical protein